MAHPHHLVPSSSSFCYSNNVSSTNPTTHLVSQVPGFNPNPDPEIYSLASGIEMIGFQPREEDQEDPHIGVWKHGFLSKPGPGPGLDKGQEFYRQHDDDHNENMMGEGDDDEDDVDRTCVFPCQGNERPSQGLSLSLSSSNPSTIGLQSFQLRHDHHHHGHHHHHHGHHDQSRLLMMGKSSTFSTQDEFFMGSMQLEMMRNSKYLAPCQQLLNEFCNLGTKQKSSSDHGDNSLEKNKKKLKNKVACDMLHIDHDHLQNNTSSSSSSSQSLYGLNPLELQKRKTKLLGMLEELDRRYKHYYEQMKGVVSSFEVVAGHGAANVYLSLASKVMSRHFRCLRDVIVGQIKATKKAIGDKDASTIVPGTTKGETPRLRVLDQVIRQQRALQQMTMIENHPWRPQRGLPERSVSVLRAWLFEHFLHPYPSDVDKHILARQTGLSRSQVSNWFINARVRLWKPMVEQMYQEANKDVDQDHNSPDSNFFNNNVDHQSNEQPPMDQKPTPDQLLIRIEPDSLSSIVNTTTTTTTTTTSTKSPHSNNFQESPYGRNNNNTIEAFGSVEGLDFPYGAHTEDNNGTQAQAHQGFGSGGSGTHVSLTLGLQQHGVNNGVSLAYSPGSQGSLYYGRDHIDHNQYSLIDGDQTAQNLPYRNLMGAQLLHDFA